MTKVLKCPICEKGNLEINVLKGYKISFNGKISKMLNRVYCTNCKRNIKYELVKTEN